MIKTIFFDFWGTLVENGVRSPVKQIKRILDIRLPFPEYVIRMERAMMTRRYDSLRDAFESICQEFSLDCDEDTLNELIGMWNKSWMLAEPYQEVVEVLAELQQEYQLVLVSNTDHISVETVLEKYNLAQYFNQIFLSYNVGLIKTDREFFRRVLEELELNPEDCVMVGDSIQSDIMAAKQQGMKAVLVDRRDSRDYHLKVKDLKELKDILENRC